MSARYDITEAFLVKSNYRPIHAGDDYDHSFTVERAGAALDLGGAKIWFTVKKDTNDADSEAKLQYVSTDVTEIEITDGPNGKFVIHLKDTDTHDMEGTWNYDIKSLLNTGKILRIARGVIQFLPNITQAYA
jgi:hypothetical protein